MSSLLMCFFYLFLLLIKKILTNRQIIKLSKKPKKLFNIFNISFISLSQFLVKWGKCKRIKSFSFPPFSSMFYLFIFLYHLSLLLSPFFSHVSFFLSPVQLLFFPILTPYLYFPLLSTFNSPYPFD